MAESLDSRTAAFDRKRGLDEGLDEDRSLSQKRLKSSTLPRIGIESTGDGGGKETGESTMPFSSQPIGFAPSINWNAGTRTKIRTTLGGAPKDQRMPSHSETAVIPPSSELVADTVACGSPVTAISPRVSLDEGSGNGELNSRQTLLSNKVQGQEVGSIKKVAQSLPPDLRPATPIVNLPSSPADIANNPSEDAHDDGGGGVVLNLICEENGEDEAEEYESGEIHDSERLGLEGKCYTHGNPEADMENEKSSISGLGEPIEDAELLDAMMSYSNSNPGSTTPKHLNRGTTVVAAKRRTLTLRDLDSEDFSLQLRYFYVACDPSTIDYNDPVRCLICAKDGHTSDFCSALTCSSCGVHGDHFTAACPKSWKCEKCRERGHAKKECPYKLGRLAGKELECDLCKQAGHVEVNCELVWRTSGFWESELPNFSIRLACYECGKAGHLGNDCPTRNPKKPIGSSTWTFKPAKENKKVADQSRTGIAIKGRAEQMKRIEIDDSEDEHANFHQTRIPQPVRSGQVRVASDKVGRYQGSLWTPGDGIDEREIASGVDYRGNVQRQPPNPPAPVRIGSFNPKDSRFRGSDTYTPNNASAAGASRTRTRPKKKSKRPAQEASTYRPMSRSAAWKKRRT